jgi:hypothetical protein
MSCSRRSSSISEKLMIALRAKFLRNLKSASVVEQHIDEFYYYEPFLDIWKEW